MTKLLVAGLSALAALSAALPAHAVTNWQGEAVITSAALPCRNNPDQNRRIFAGQVYRSAYKPANVDDNGPNTDISFMSRLTARSYRLLNGLPSGTYELRGFNIFAGWNSTTGTYTNFSVVPAAAVGVPRVYIQGRIDDFASITGCTVVFKGAYVLRPD